MQSMRSMQNEMMKDCRWDGGYPKAVHMGLGIIAIAHSKEQEEEFEADTRRSWKIAIWVNVVLAAIMIPLIIWACGP